MKTEMHSPGGKRNFRLPQDVLGSAEFSECMRYRHILWRRWEPDGEYALWVGMNPSTASHDVDDPTVAREWKLTRQLGFAAMAKANVLDVRLTDSKQLSKLTFPARSEANLPAIERLASGAALIVVAWGNLHRSLRPHAAETLVLLRATGKPIMCRDVNKNGTPKHPLYVPQDKPLIPFC